MTVLVETAAAVVRIRDILSVAGVDEVMVGLNDLRIELCLRNVFELLVSPLLENLAAETRLRNLPFQWEASPGWTTALCPSRPIWCSPSIRGSRQRERGSPVRS